MISYLFKIDILTLIMSGLVLFLGIITFKFSSNYMKGDVNYKNFLRKIILITTTIILAFLSNNIILFSLFWLISNYLLVRLMIHKNGWSQAVSSANYAFLHLIPASLLISIGLIILSLQSHSLSFSEIIMHRYDMDLTFIIAIAIIILGASLQSALWPFNKWLISSLNSPTPVSSMMHAGLVNGGGFVLIKLAPIYANNIIILNIIFIIGAISAFLGTGFKLVQTNNKTMLACSTMAQMGCMIMECGLGLYIAALSHIIWHSLFKSYLFFYSGNIVKEKRIKYKQPFSAAHFVIFINLIATEIFSKISGIDYHNYDSNFFLIIIAMIAFLQFSWSLASSRKYSYFTIIFSVLAASSIYGFNIHLIHLFVADEIKEFAYNLNIIHFLILAIFFFSWIITVKIKELREINKIKNLLNYLYVKLLNSSLPAPKTITSNRGNYKF